MDLLRHLRYFVVTGEELHFGRAAERLGIAQPPLSQRIRGLERELGVRLFDRSRRQVRLTAAGEVLLAEAQAVLGRVARMRELTARADAGTYGTLRVGVPPEIPGSVLGAVLTEFAAAAPDVRLELRELAGTEQTRLLGDRRLDAGLVPPPVDPGGGLASGPEIDFPLGVVVPRGSPLAGAADVPLAELAGESLVTFPREVSPGLYDAVLAACREAGFHPAELPTAHSPEVMLGLVIAGYGVAFSHPAIARKEPRVVWRRAAPRAPEWRLVFAWPERGAHPAVPLLVRTATRVLRADGAGDPPAGDAAPPDAAPRPWNVVYGAG
ncbi:LysR family transcriptional regulator [Streptomyces sp. JJ36]|uniref:LysR family transcriptional regulator n=1 Tax=Streptomyces sp. JJ36 TaxID=2736645 RepID=UPI001F3F010D|nr:LysR family transcriptional regulator [Streptomyces sp. JJ36]MCF6521781.1 LysR family transcriptional regulator [Streptomyces sp. JJ36]